MSATPFLEPWLDALVAALDAAGTGPSQIDLTKTKAAVQLHKRYGTTFQILQTN
jgi:hypothetical protein